MALTTATPAVALSRPPLPPDMPRIVNGPCPGYPNAGGCFLWDEATIYSNGLSRYGLEHELGHAYDAEVLDDAERASFAQRIHRARRPWDTTYTADGRL